MTVYSARRQARRFVCGGMLACAVGAGLCGATPAQAGKKTCLTGTDPEVGNDLGADRGSPCGGGGGLPVCGLRRESQWRWHDHRQPYPTDVGEEGPSGRPARCEQVLQLGRPMFRLPTELFTSLLQLRLLPADSKRR